MKPLQNGWHEVDKRTEICIVKGKPTHIRSTATDLDRATDNAAQFYGEPLETGEWQPQGAGDAPWVTECFPSSELDDDGFRR